MTEAWTRPNPSKPRREGGRCRRPRRSRFHRGRRRSDVNVFDEVVETVTTRQREGRKALIAAVSQGSRDRIKSALRDHGAGAAVDLGAWAEVKGLDVPVIGLVVLNIARGFLAPGVAVISEQDILGDRLTRGTKPRIKPENIIREAGQLTPGDLVVHSEHGIGRFEGLETIAAWGAPPPGPPGGLAADERLYFSVGKKQLVGRSDPIRLARLDRLGARVGGLERPGETARPRHGGRAGQGRGGPRTSTSPHHGFARWHLQRIRGGFPPGNGRSTERHRRRGGDLASGRPTDRLVCGDVGFGKTEVALRAAFVAAMSGKQVAVVTPTTLLCRQHFDLSSQNAVFPIEVAQLSRLVTGKKASGARRLEKRGGYCCRHSYALGEDHRI